MGVAPRQASGLCAPEGYLQLGDSAPVAPATLKQADFSDPLLQHPAGAAADRRRCAKVAVSVAIFFGAASLIPIYNKMVFSGTASLQQFEYPIAVAFLQLGLASVVLGLASLTSHTLKSRSRESSPHSWLFGPHFGYKLRHAGPAGLCFGVKFAATNLGLQLVPTSTHLLLQATDLLWTAALARWVNNEHLTHLEALAVLCSTLGAVLVSVDTAQLLDAAAVPLLVNCLTPLLLALSVTTLRSGVQVLLDPCGRLGGTMGVGEFTCIRLAVASLTCLACAWVLEGGGIRPSRLGGVAGSSPRPPWWTALAAYPSEGTALVLLAGVFVLIFQVNVAWLTQLTSAVTVGVVGGAKVIPQWILSEAVGLDPHLGPLALSGAALVLASSVLYLFAAARPLALGSSGIGRAGDAPC